MSDGMENVFNCQEDVNINRNNLDAEWAKRPANYNYWCEQFARELRKKDEIWLEKKVLKAVLFKEARVKLTENGKAPSDTRCDVEVHADPRYRDVSARLIIAEERVNILSGIKWSLVEKGKSLEELSKDKKIGKDMPDGYKEQYRESVHNINEESEKADLILRSKIKRG